MSQRRSCASLLSLHALYRATSNICCSWLICNIRSRQPQEESDQPCCVTTQVAVGLSHAGLLTRRGEMYSWGDGHGGKLGLGHQIDAESPQRLHTLWGQPVRHIAVSGLLPGCQATRIII